MIRPNVPDTLDVKKGSLKMGRLVRIVNAKKQKIVNTLISEDVYQPDDRPFLLELPLKNLEEILSLRMKSSFQNPRFKK